MVYDTDVIVVGAGPAGSLAAYTLASQGIQVTILEKTMFPRYKVCGGGLWAAGRSFAARRRGWR